MNEFRCHAPGVSGVLVAKYSLRKKLLLLCANYSRIPLLSLVFCNFVLDFIPHTDRRQNTIECLYPA